eukprot:UN03730
MRTLNKLNTKRTKTLQRKSTKKVHNVKKRTSTTQQKRNIIHFHHHNRIPSNNIISNHNNNLAIIPSHTTSSNVNKQSYDNITTIYTMDIPLLTTAQRYLHHRKTQQHIAQFKQLNLPNITLSTVQGLSQNNLQLNRSIPFHKRSIARHFSTTTTTTDDNNNNNK